MKTLRLFPWILLTLLFPARAYCGVDLAVFNTDNLQSIVRTAAGFDSVEWMILAGLAVWVTLGFYNMRPRSGR